MIRIGTIRCGRRVWFNRVTLTVLLLGLITLYGCQDLVPHDTRSLLIPRFRRSEILGFVAGFWNDFCRFGGLGSDAQASVKRGHEPKDGGLSVLIPRTEDQITPGLTTTLRLLLSEFTPALAQS